MKIRRVLMDKAVSPSRETAYLLSKIGQRPETVSSANDVYDRVNRADDPVSFAKTLLYITRNHGAVVRECPGTSHYTCCGYTILHTGTFCTMDCSYCILQAYFHPPVLQYFAGLDQLKQALGPLFSQNKIFRIGTGEYTDSLIWEPISLQPGFLVKTFARQSNSVLELKTKTVNVASLLDLEPNGKTILAWSVNTPEIIRTQERGTSALTSRLETARKAESRGYKLAFHFDPLVIYQGCTPAYKDVIHAIFRHVSPENIAWISLGTFRFMPALKPIIRKRFPDSTICLGEFIPGLDNKMRYFKPLRIQLYKELATLIKAYAPGVLVYFCMEDAEVWEKSMGFYPGGNKELGALLDRAALDCCGLNPSLK